MTMHAEIIGGTWVVVDVEGGVWWPDDKAAAEIAAADDPETAAIKMAENEPQRGTWSN